MRPKSLMLLLLALGCGLVAAVSINQVLANRVVETAADTGEMVPIYMASTDIALGDPITPERIKLEPWPKSKIPKGAMTKLEDIDGRRARTRIISGYPITDSALFAKGEQGGGFTDTIPKGKVVVPVKVTDDVTSGLLLPGDRVNLLVHMKQGYGDNQKTITRTFLTNIPVSAINDVYNRDANGTTTIAAKTVSLEVTPDQSELITLASLMGDIRLALRSPTDDSEHTTSGVTPGELLGGGKPAHSDVKNDLLSLLNQKPAQEQPPKAGAEPTKDSWKMVVIDGSSVKEYEMDDGDKIGSRIKVRQLTEGDGGSTDFVPSANTPMPAASPAPQDVPTDN